MPELDTITQFENFWLFLDKAINLCHDLHLSKTIPYETQANIDSSVILLNEQYHRFFWEKGYVHMPLSVFKYYDGKYYFYAPIRIDYDDNTKKIHIKIGTQLLAIDNIPVDDYIVAINQLYCPTTWDKKYKKLFSIRIQSQVTKENLTIKDNKGEIKNINYRGHISIYSNGSSSLYVPYVDYFKDTKILYIRIPAMNEEFIPYFQTNIGKKCYGKEINKVIIDVRANGGGSDFVWQAVLSALISQPLITPQKLLVRNTDMVRNYFKEIQNQDLSRKPIIQIPSLDNESYIDFDNDSAIEIIEPSNNSISYAGKIYILSDERTYSAGLSLVDVANNHPEKFITIGESGGYIGGRGGDPFVFVLPNSKITFRLNAMLDYYNVSDIEDFFHDKIMYPVQITPEEYAEFMLTEKGRFSKKFLYKKDRIFQKAMEIE